MAQAAQSWPCADVKAGSAGQVLKFDDFGGGIV
jgi:hypothetical protein